MSDISGSSSELVSLHDIARPTGNSDRFDGADDTRGDESEFGCRRCRDCQSFGWIDNSHAVN